MSTFPSVLTTYTDPFATNRLNAPSHSGIERAQNSGVSQVEAVIGVEGSASVVGSLQYLIKSPASDGGGHVQAVNKGGTGLTSYNKGDLLIGSSSSVLTKLAVAPDGAFLKTNSSVATGITWGAIPGTPVVRVYDTPGVAIWNKPSVLSYIMVEMVGGGGAGGGSGNNSKGGGGGAGAGYSRKVYNASLLGIAASVVTAAGGTAGTAGSNPGNPGSISSFAPLGAPSIRATGGAGGIADSATGNPSGGIGSGGDLNAKGQGGFNINAGVGTGLPGGASYFGGGGAVQQSNDTQGNPGGAYGGGGSGGYRAAVSQSGGAGADGVVIIYEY